MCSLVRMIHSRCFIAWNHSSECDIAQKPVGLTCMRKLGVLSFLGFYKSVMFTNALSEYFIGMSCAFLPKRGQHIFCEVNSNGRCSPFVCCICFVKLPCLSRYTVDCSVWNVSCTCVSARLYFVTEDDLLKSSFMFVLATSKQLFHFIHAFQ